MVGAVADGDCIFALTEAGAADFAPTVDRCSRFPQIELPHQPGPARSGAQLPSVPDPQIYGAPRITLVDRPLDPIRLRVEAAMGPRLALESLTELSSYIALPPAPMSARIS